MEKYYFCPNHQCENHQLPVPTTNWYTPNGEYITKTFGAVPRYKCKNCGAGFSRQTFSLNYFAKKIVDYKELIKQIVTTSNCRAITRNMKISMATLANRTERLARQHIAYHADQLQQVKLAENMAADGFESFCVSQNFPNNIHLLIGSDSQYVYGMNYVLLRRKGRMTDKQKQIREELEKQVQYPEKAIEKSFGNILELVDDLTKQSTQDKIILYTDKKTEYQSALSNAEALQQKIKEGKFAHNTVSSRAARTKDNPLFPVNYLDRELRKDAANHRRETVCFARNVVNMLNRLVVYFHWHNYQKPFRIDDKVESRYQHAEKTGLDRARYEADMVGLYDGRRILSLCSNVKSFWKQLWTKEIPTMLKEGRDYLPGYALM